MGGYGNPLVGSGWNNPMGQTSPINLNMPVSQGEHGSFGTGPMGNPGNLGDFGSTGSLNKNIMLNNVIAGQYKNQLAPQFAQQMGRYAGPAASYYQQLMNLGSPFYQQRQTQAFNQGVQQNQNADAQARQQLASQGYGNTPSGAQAAMMGGMAQQGSQNLAEQYLQNLFQNEMLQSQGAQGLFGLANLFNPTQLLSGTGAGTSPATTNPTGAFANIMGSLFGSRGAVGAMPGQQGG